jgi:hypothetical protein
MPKTFIRRTGRRAARQKNFGRTRLQSLRQTSGGLPSRLAAKSLPAENPKNVFLPRNPPACPTKYFIGHKSTSVMYDVYFYNKSRGGFYYISALFIRSFILITF